MMSRTLAAVLLSLTACTDLGLEDGDQLEIPTQVEPRPTVALAAELEQTVFTALASTRHDAYVLRSGVDHLGSTHVRIRQLVKDIPVWEGVAIVHVAPDGSTELTDHRIANVDIDTSPRVKVDRAEAIARGACTDCAPRTAPDLWILRDDRDRLVWRVQLAGTQNRREVMPIVFVDAHDGTIVRQWDNVQYATGHTQYNGTRSIPSYLSSNRYYLEDNEYNLGVYDLRSGTNPDNDSFTRLYSPDPTITRGDAAQAMYSVRSVAEYFWGIHDRWNPDGAGGPGKVASVDQSGRKRLSVFIDSQFVRDDGTIYGANATWTGVLKLGKGDAEWGDLTSLDIVGHEFTHGVIEHSAGLVYMNESGAINESFADVFGAMTERYRLGESANTWRIGEDAFTVDVAGGELRRMDDPTSDDVSVDHYSDLQIGGWDNGYVHTNSGIGNKAFHLVAAGGTHSRGGAMRGIGADRAAEIWYHALTTYLTEGSKYLDARSATQNAARDLFGYQSPEWNAVSNAWALCGLGIVSNDGFVNGNFETDAGWTLSGRAFTSTGYPQSGTRYLQLGGLAASVGTATQDFAIDPYAQTATLSFYVNVTSSDVNKAAPDKLVVDILDADTGAFISRVGTWSNYHRTTAGTYSYEGAFNLSHLRGRSLRMKLSATNDLSNPTTFRVDNIQLSVNR
jgi:thermolysin